MTSYVQVVGESSIKVWGLTTEERLRRQIAQLKDVRLIGQCRDLPENSRVLLLRGDYVTETRVIEQLLSHDHAGLRCPGDQRLAALVTTAGKAEKERLLLSAEVPEVPEDLTILEPAALAGYDKTLRKADNLFLEHLSEQSRAQIENRLYGSAYKGITDLVTKWLWPRPAKKGVRFCANLGITPNQVTGTGVALMVIVSFLFCQGWYLTGLILGWFMTYLDTVDGKLARVTVQSSRIGHILDHGMDMVHPPFWYWFWGVGLASVQPVMGFDKAGMIGLIFAGYVLGRIAEQLFHLLGNSSLFTWRPFDAYFRLVTARRNPCLIILTVAVILGRPDWGFIGVVVWTVVTTAILWVRLLQGLLVRLHTGPLQPWMKDKNWARQTYPKSYQWFAGTQSAYSAEG